MKKIFLLLVLFLAAGSAWAKNVEVECLTPVHEDMEVYEFKAKVLKEVKFNSGLVFRKNDVINMHIKEIVEAKKGGRSAYIIVRPVSFVEEEKVETENGVESREKLTFIEDKTLEGKTTSIKVISKADIKQHIHDDWKDDLKKAGKGVTKKVVNTAVPGASQIYQVSKGMIHPAEGQTRLQSAANNVIDDSVFKHLKKGHDLDIKKGDKFFLKFYHTDIPKWRFIARNN